MREGGFAHQLTSITYPMRSELLQSSIATERPKSGRPYRATDGENAPLIGTLCRPSCLGGFGSRWWANRCVCPLASSSPPQKFSRIEGIVRWRALSQFPSVDWVIFLSGFVGAMATEIVRFWRIRKRKLARIRPSYVVVSLAFFLLGGFLAWILEAGTPQAAFVMGCSTDALVSGMAGGHRKQVYYMPTGDAVYLTLREYLAALFPL